MLREELTGRLAQVGSSCVGLFLQGVDAEGLVAECEARAAAGALAEEAHHGGRGGVLTYAYTEPPPYVPVRRYLELVAATIRHLGWVSVAESIRRGDGTEPTAVVAQRLLVDATGREAAGVLVTPEDQARVEAAVRWVEGMERPDEFQSRLRTVATLEHCRATETPTLAALVTSYGFAMEREMDRQRRRVGAAGRRFVGEIRERREFVLRLEWVRVGESEFGPLTIHRFRDDQGNLVSWLTSRRSELTVGNRYIVRATPTEHKPPTDKRVEPETRVTRLVTLADLGVAPEVVARQVEMPAAASRVAPALQVADDDLCLPGL
jgi:hypothetical protein